MSKQTDSSGVDRSDGVIPSSSQGFLKVGAEDGRRMDGSQRSALIRRGNELFNNGDYATAKRIFITVRYSDGLIRVGNQCMKQGDTLEAFRLFWIAGDTRRVAEMTEQMAMVVRKWLHDDIPRTGDRSVNTTPEVSRHSGARK